VLIHANHSQKDGKDRDPLLSTYMGPDVDKKFNDILVSLGRIAAKNAKPVIDSIRRWRTSQQETLSGDCIRMHSSTSSYAAGRPSRNQEIVAALNERKSLASIYIMCQALIRVISSVNRDALPDAIGYSLEETIFEQFKKPDLKLLAQSHNHRQNAELYATLLGALSNLR